MHYFLLLLVPLALTRPTLSPLWFVPLAYQPLGMAAWPGGDARRLGLALVATLVILGGALVRPDWGLVVRRLSGRERTLREPYAARPTRSTDRLERTRG